MSARSLDEKKRRRAIRALRKGLPARLDLVQWLLDRDYVQTKKEARDLILSGRVRSESQVLGIAREEVPAPTAALDMLMGREASMVEKKVVAPYIDANLRSSIIVL